jgi:drug/metabolite transporter, DME family
LPPKSGLLSPYARGVLLVIAATVLWSLSGLFVRNVPSVDPWTLNAYRGFSTGCFLSLYMLIRYGRAAWGHVAQSGLKAILLSGGFFALGSTLYIVALSLASVASVSCLGATSPLFAALLAWLVMREKTSPRVLLATIAVLIGVYFIVTAESAEFAGGFLGSLVGLAVAFCFAGQTVMLRRFRNLEMTPAIAIGGFACAVAIGALHGLVLLPAREMLIIVAMGLIQLAIPLVLYIEGAKHVTAVQGALIALGDVVLNPFWAWLGTGEVPPTGTYVGGAVIVVAIIAATVQRRNGEPAIPVVPRIE